MAENLEHGARRSSRLVGPTTKRDDQPPFESVFSSLKNEADIVIWRKPGTLVESGETATTTSSDRAFAPSIPYDQMGKMYATCVKKWETDRQCFTNFGHLFAKQVYQFFTLDKGPQYFLEIVMPENHKLLQEDQRLRRYIAEFTAKFFPDTSAKDAAVVLSDYGKQKRKNEKQKEERKDKRHECHKCKLLKKNATDRANHEKVCNRKPVERPRRKRAAAVRASKIIRDISKGKLWSKSPYQFGNNPYSSVNFKSPQYEKELEMLRQKNFPGLAINQSSLKGGSLVAVKGFKPGELLCEYEGELLEGKAGIKSRHDLYDEMYDNGQAPGSYMFEFEFRNKRYCVDATKDVGWGRYANHCKDGNARMEIMEYSEAKFAVVLRARKEIVAGAAIEWDYGVRDRRAFVHFPWLEQ